MSEVCCEFSKKLILKSRTKSWLLHSYLKHVATEKISKISRTKRLNEKISLKIVASQFKLLDGKSPKYAPNCHNLKVSIIY